MNNNIQKEYEKSNRIYHSNAVKFKWLYNINGFKKKICIFSFLGILLAFLTTIMVEQTGLYTGGTSAFFQGIARLVRTALYKSDPQHDELNNIIYEMLYWGQYLILNLALGVFAYKKVGKKFTYYSLSFIVSCQVAGFIFSSIFANLHINFNFFGETAAVDTRLSNANIKCLFFNITTLPDCDTEWVLDWTHVYSISAFKDIFGDKYFSFVYAEVLSSNLVKILSLFIYAIFFGIISGIIDGLTYILGGSTAGSDFYIVYLARKNGTPIGRKFILINGTFMCLGAIFGSSCSTLIIDSAHYLNIYTFLTGNIFASFIWVIVTGMWVDKTYPKEKMFRTMVYSSKANNVINALKTVNFPGTIYVENINQIHTTGNTTNNEAINFICSYTNLSKTIDLIKVIDENAKFINIEVDDYEGKL